MFCLISAMAEFERALIQERIKSGLRHAKEKGILPERKISGTPGEQRCGAVDSFKKGKMINILHTAVRTKGRYRTLHIPQRSYVQLP
jgi:DNA invertase Pin-like site-specific DNA recombinase